MADKAYITAPRRIPPVAQHTYSTRTANVQHKYLRVHPVFACCFCLVQSAESARARDQECASPWAPLRCTVARMLQFFEGPTNDDASKHREEAYCFFQNSEFFVLWRIAALRIGPKAYVIGRVRSLEPGRLAAKRRNSGLGL